MNIQSNINQALSIAGFLASQTPMAEDSRAKYMEKQATKEAYKSKNKYDKYAEKGKDIDLAVEERIEKYREETGREPTLQEKLQWAEGEAAAQSFIAEKGKSATERVFQANPTDETYEDFVIHAASEEEVKQQRDKYISNLTAEERDKAKAKQEEDRARKEEEKRAQREADRKARDEERRAQKEADRKAREDEKARKAEDARVRQEKAEEKARQAQELEQQRLLRSKILEGIYSPLTDIPERQAGHEKRLEEGKY